ncbi:exodeoxyribonuclease VII large subunit [Hydrogenimonas urashimensis]|uniref:exodeoxyribonuclease VII large subunit n=1 Tax=Hydrogenimonas urashimensis TaxID=2740515 RepID=UPI001915F251|nr:exodeoxyribonuclease VII large subunit [Hydrogenimonas urashimensis]
MQTLTVSEINEQIKSLLESTFLQIRVEGEISRVTYHSSGHIYFTIKDAKSALSCVMFRSNARHLRFRLEEGAHVVLGGSITVYVPRGNYQMMVQTAEPYGAGALSVAFEQLKKRLEEEGLFAVERKKPIPRIIRHIAIVTSKTGAAIQDMIRVAKKRWPLVKITLVDTLVQGGEAAEEIARHIAYADRLGADVIVVGRGGGSLEDLWAFNEEVVARAIAACDTPVVSAVGHEVDTLISDFVADMRAPTPSAAMEQILPDRTEVLMALDEMMDRMGGRMHQILSLKKQLLTHMQSRLEQYAIGRKIELQLETIRELKNRMRQQMAHLLARKRDEVVPLAVQLRMTQQHLLQSREQQLRALEAQMAALDPRSKLRPGFVQLVKEDRAVTLEKLKPKDRVRLEDGRHVAEATIDSVRPVS